MKTVFSYAIGCKDAGTCPLFHEGYDRTGQDKTKQDKTRQDKTNKIK